MTKELTPLEALKDIERVCRDSNYLADFYKQRLEIIETALKEYEELKKENLGLKSYIEYLKEEIRQFYEY